MPTFRITAPDGTTYNVTGPEGSTPEQALEKVKAQYAKPAETKPEEKSFPQQLGQQVLNAGAGAIRGAGSIGATLMAPIDIAKDALAGKGLSLESNRERRQAMTDALGTMGADADSLAFGAGKVGAEIAGTLGVGGTLANAVGRALPAGAAPVVEAIRTAGMSGGGMATRAAGGALTGGASAGLVNPEDAGAGALIGGALPGAVKLAGNAGQAVGGVIRGPSQAPEVTQAVQAARAEGYVIPPTQAKPSLANRVLEGFSGKITTAQNASAKNQGVTNELAAKAIGLPPGTKITPDALDAVRAEAGKAYAAIAKLGPLDAGGANLPASVAVKKASDPLTLAPKTEVDSAELVRAWKQANADATSYFRAYGRDANPETLAKAKEAASEAKQIDDFLAKALSGGGGKGSGKSLDQLIAERSKGYISTPEFLRQALSKEAAPAGTSGLLDNLKAARKVIAKTYTVEKALNATTGSVDARKLATELQKGKPLASELRTVAEFASRFPKAAQPVEGMGSLPQISPWDVGAVTLGSIASGNLLPVAGLAARPAARALTLSDLVQNRLAQQPGQPLGLLANPAAQQLMYRAAPVASTSR